MPPLEQFVANSPSHSKVPEVAPSEEINASNDPTFALTNPQIQALFKKRAAHELLRDTLMGSAKDPHVQAVNAIQQEMRMSGIKEEEYVEFVSTAKETSNKDVTYKV